MKPLIRFAILLLGGASLASAATTQLLNIDLGSTAGMTGGAVLGTSGDVWNNPGLSGTSNATLTTPAFLNWADGSGPSTIKLTQTSEDFYAGAGTAGDNLMRDYVYLYAGSGTTSTGPVNFRLTGFTPSTILTSIVFYGKGNAVDQNASFTTTIFNGTSNVSSTQTTDLTSAYTTANYSGNFVQFDNVVVDSGGNVDFTWTNPSGGSDWSAFNGMQIAVPEPSAALLGGLGMLVLLRRRRN